MKAINVEFRHDEKKDHQANGKPECQSKDVDKGEDLILHQVSPCRLQIVFKHTLFYKDDTIPVCLVKVPISSMHVAWFLAGPRFYLRVNRVKKCQFQ